MRVAHITKHMRMGGIPVYIATVSRALKNEGFESIVVSSGGVVADQNRDAFVSFVFDLDVKFEFHPKLFFVIPRLIRLIKDQKIDLLHAHTRVGQLVAALLSFFCGIPYVVTMHGMYKRRLGRILFPCLGKRAIAISQPVADDLMHIHHAPSSLVTCVCNGIEMKRFTDAHISDMRKHELRSRLSIPTHAFVVGMVARMIFQKGGSDFIDALEILHSRSRNVFGVLVGDGTDRLAFEEIIRSKGLEKAIVCVGSILKVDQMLSAWDAFVHPVRVEEGFGLSIAEAMAARLPVVVTDKWVLWSKFEDQEIGVKVPVERADLIADAIENFIQHPDLAHAMGVRAATAARKYFDIQSTAKAIGSIYKDACRVE